MTLSVQPPASEEEVERRRQQRLAYKQKTGLTGQEGDAAYLSNTYNKPFDFAGETAKIKTALGPAPDISYTPLAKDFAAAYRPKEVKGLGPEFFDIQRQNIKEQLRQEVFGPTGQAQQVASGESAAGRLGSGVGKRILEETVGRPFAEKSIQIDRDILSAQLQESARVQQFNAEQSNQFTSLVANLEQADSSNALTAATARATLSGQYSELAARLADAQAGRATQEQIARLDADTRIFITSQDTLIKANALAEEKRSNMVREAEEFRRGGTQYLQTVGQFRPETANQQGAATTLAQAYGFPQVQAQVREGPAQNPSTAGRYVGDVVTQPDGSIWRWNGAEWKPV